LTRVLFGPERLLFGSARLLFGSERLLFGSTRVLFGSTRVLFGSARLLFGSTRLLFGSTRLLFGSARLLFGSTRLLFGSTRLLFGSRRALFGSTRVLFGSTRVLFGFAAFGDSRCSCGLRLGWLLDKAFRRDAQISVQLPDHLEGQRPFMTEDLVDSIGAADHWLQILHGEPTLLHHELDGLDRIGQLQGKVLAFVGFDQCGQHIEALTFG
jgi:hypothetical protein